MHRPYIIFKHDKITDIRELANVAISSLGWTNYFGLILFSMFNNRNLDTANVADYSNLGSLVRHKYEIDSHNMVSKFYQKTGGHMLTAKIGTNRSDRVVWPSGLTEQSDRSRHCGQSGRGLTGLTGGSDRSDRSRRNPTVIRVLNRFRSINMIFCGVSLPHPINIKCHGRLRISNRTKLIQSLYFILFSKP